MTIVNGSSVSLDTGLVTPFVESIDNAASNGTWNLIFLHLFPVTLLYILFQSKSSHHVGSSVGV